jgi:hypothetical protein
MVEHAAKAVNRQLRDGLPSKSSAIQRLETARLCPTSPPPPLPSRHFFRRPTANRSLASAYPFEGDEGSAMGPVRERVLTTQRGSHDHE